MESVETLLSVGKSDNLEHVELKDEQKVIICVT